MSLAVFFWLLYVIAVLAGLYLNYEAGQPLWYRRAGGYLLIWVLLGILGYATFGPVIHR